ncbi:hypothetical protein EI42_02339 [Thermosporothrix hazakensis]|uniref:Uncharacterized protein n=1 Tax=Thermosporothrix hazakensis TaxID=644383 RepID=A0A326UC26_THEHA|nr:hypothetical protein [Thermosporothrix hazakensis]PZW31242.1 hypothetical protein EI42_02339 [Thermosporothrix hazakensis]
MFTRRSVKVPRAAALQFRLVRAELWPGRRWGWFGSRGWWVQCSLLHDARGSWQVRRFLPSLHEACLLLHIHEDDLKWLPEPSPGQVTPSGYYPFLMI